MTIVQTLIRWNYPPAGHMGY